MRRAWRLGCLAMLTFWLAAGRSPGQGGAPAGPPPTYTADAPRSTGAPSQTPPAAATATTSPATLAPPRLRVTPAPGRLRLVEFYSAT